MSSKGSAVTPWIPRCPGNERKGVGLRARGLTGRSKCEKAKKQHRNVLCLFCVTCVSSCSHMSHAVLLHVLPVTHLKTCLNDDIHELLHVAIAEHSGNEAPPPLHLSLFIAPMFRFFKRRVDLLQLKIDTPGNTTGPVSRNALRWSQSSALWTERHDGRSQS